jgi:HAMP domain-containing protein
MAPAFNPQLDERSLHNPPRTGGLSLTGYMLVLIAAIMLPMLALVAIVARDYGLAARRTIEAQRLDVASNIRILMDREIDRTAGFLDGISNAPRLRAHDAEFIEQVTAVARERGYRALVVYDLSGEATVASAALRQPAPAASVGLAEIKAGAKVFVSSLIANAGDKPGLYFVSVPIVHDGAVVAMLTAGLPPGRLQRLLFEAGLREGWSAGIVDRDGILLARSRLPERYVGTPAQQPMLDEVHSGRFEGLFDVVDRDGVNVKNAFERSKLSGWSTGVAVPAVIVDAPLWHTAIIMTLIGVALTLVSLLLALMVASHLSRAIRRMGIAAVAIASGDVVRMPATHIAELRDVSRSIEFTGAVARRGRQTDPPSP